MEIGDEIKLKGTVVNFDSNPQGSAIKVKILGFLDQEEKNRLQSREEKWEGGKRVDFIEFWIHRLDQPQTLIKEEER